MTENDNVNGKQIVDAKELSINDWLKIILSPKQYPKIDLYQNYCFPSDYHRDVYLSDIEIRSEKEVKNLIRRFLIPTGSLGCDRVTIRHAVRYHADSALNTEYVLRTARGGPPWEGITWVLDLLHRPRMAIQVIHAYLSAHFWWMPDWRINGLFDAMRLIRAAFLDPIHPRDELLTMAPRDFEFIVGLLFQRMEFQVTLTKQTADGGFDIRLWRCEAGNVESSVVECKRYTRNVPVKEIRALLGVVERNNLSRGLLVTTNGFTRAAKCEASQTNRIELIDFPKLCRLLNEHFGTDWLTNIDQITSTARRKFDDRIIIHDQ